MVPSAFMRSGCLRVGVVLLGAIAMIGCGPNETGSSSGGGTGGTTTTGPLCPDDPADGPVAEECGIWVSASQGKDTNPGTQGAPVATLAHAIELADAGPLRVYACGETWNEAPKIPSGVSLHGGFDCDAGWKYVGDAKRAKLLASEGIAIRILKTGHTEGGSLTDFYVEAPDATEPGGSSVPFQKESDQPFRIARCEFRSGNGAKGADGEPGDPNDAPAAPGMPGTNGADACSGITSKGGASTETVCSMGTSQGGAGGDSGPMVAADGQAGTPAGDPASGAAGLGEQSAPQCTAGTPGANGAPGDYGFGGGRVSPNDLGHLTDTGYIARRGDDGLDGKPGQGGGGGGATFGSAQACGAAKPAGAAGGSGGSGGCGGRGGRGGQGGGGSFGLVLIGSGKLTFGSLHMTVGNGGDGGNGGAPQKGGAGAVPGLGGNGAGTINTACAGGQGGDGGKGGWGGGGIGGMVAAILYRQSVTFGWENSDVTWKYGKGGNPGFGDPDHGSTSAGIDGQAGDTIYLPP